jgi:hypothetical protein
MDDTAVAAFSRPVAPDGLYPVHDLSARPGRLTRDTGVLMQKYQPALLGGVFIGVLSSLPVINIANCCCLWVITGGMLVVYLQQQGRFEPVETADAVVGGLLAGLIGAIITTVVTTMIFTAGTALMQDQFRTALENPDMPPEVRDMMTRLFTGSSMGVLMFAINIPLYSIFGMLGALLGLAIFRKKMPPQMPPPPPVITT